MFWLMYFTFGVFAMTDLWPQEQRMGIEKMLKQYRKKYENQFAVLMRTILCGNMILPKDYWHGWSIEIDFTSRMEPSILPLPPLPKENVFSYYGVCVIGTIQYATCGLLRLLRLYIGKTKNGSRCNDGI